MVLLSVNHDKNILDEVIIAKFENLLNLLQGINTNPGIFQSDLRKRCKIGGGKIYYSVKALKAMKLAENGNGLRLTEFGKKMLDGYSFTRRIPKEMLKDACLNVPLFNKVYQENKDIKDPLIVFRLFEKELRDDFPNVDSRLIGSAVRRYLKGVYGIQLRAGQKTGSINSKRKETNLNLYPPQREKRPQGEMENQIITTLNVINEIKKQPLESSIKKYGKKVVKLIVDL